MIRKIYEKTTPDLEASLKNTCGQWRRDMDAAEKAEKALEGAEKKGKEALRRIMKQCLSDDPNPVISPAAVLSILMTIAQISEGRTKEEILDAAKIPEKDMQAVGRSLTEGLNLNTYEAKLSCVNSIWAGDQFDINEDALRSICENGQIAAFAGEMGTDEINSEIADWINRNTAGMLKEFAKDIKTREDEIFDIISALYMKSRWDTSFHEEDTNKMVFHADGGDIRCDFMNGKHISDYMEGKDFKALRKDLSHSLKMSFILPDEGIDIDEFRKRDDVLDAIFGDGPEYSEYYVDIRLPKFDVMCMSKITDAFAELGVVSAFDMENADFTPVTDEEGVYISEVKQATRLKVDETGVEGASVILSVMLGMGLNDIPESREFHADRPFIFAVTKGNVPVFYGIIGNPVK